jgi:hypothetical protein
MGFGQARAVQGSNPVSTKCQYTTLELPLKAVMSNTSGIVQRKEGSVGSALAHN